jgi:hypothetical protein
MTISTVYSDNTAGHHKYLIRHKKKRRKSRKPKFGRLNCDKNMTRAKKAIARTSRKEVAG